MPQQALYLKWRPLTFDDVVGQDHITRTLRNSLKSERIRHAYLFSGPRGTGKTTTARLLAKAVNCLHDDPVMRPCNSCASCASMNEGRFLDLIEIDAATHTGVDDVRDLREKIAFTPGEGRYKVYIIDEVHRFTGNAFDALLKTLEEPPGHAIFVLATTEIDKVPATIKSRCLQFEFRRVSLMEVADRLQAIAEAEGLRIDRTALEVIARQGTGSVRDSISLLDQIVSDPTDEISVSFVQTVLGTGNLRAVQEVIEALAAQDIPRGLHIINEAIDSGSDPRQFGQQIVEYLRAVLLAQTASADLIEASAEEQDLFERLASDIPRAVLLRAIRAFNDAVNDYRGGWQPQLTLELAFIDTVHGPETDQAVAIASAPAKSAPATTPQIPPDAPSVETTAPGATPVIPATAIQSRWHDLLRGLRRYSSTGPGVLEHFRVQRVDGSTVYLCTDNELYFRRLHGEQGKLNAIARAIYDIHQVGLRVDVVLVDRMEAPESSRDPVDDSSDDPVLRMGLELGGQLKDRSSPSDGD